MKEENIKGEYQRKVDKSLIPTCNIMGVNIAAINMNWLLKYLDENLSDIKGDYVDAINRSELGLEGTEWRELIKPHLLGCLAFAQEEVTKVNLNTLRAEIVIDGIFVRISSGLGVINTNNKKPDNAFILDCDYYQTGKVDIDKVEEVAEQLHQKSTEFFRKSITQKLHEAMEPQELK